MQSGKCKFILSWDVLEQRSLSWDFCSCPCPKTKGHWTKKISLSRNKGTTERPVPGGTSHPVETLPQTQITFKNTPNSTQFIQPSAKLEKTFGMFWKKNLSSCLRSPCFDMCKIKLLLSCFKEKYLQRPKIVRLFHQI